MRSLTSFKENDFLPFEAGIGAGADFVMVSHVTVTGAGDGLPSCLSPVVCTDLLRKELGFEGIIITDSMQMQPITANYSAGEAAVMAIQAGCDMILMPESLNDAVAAVQEAVENGDLTEQRIDRSVKRILDEKKKLVYLETTKTNHLQRQLFKAIIQFAMAFLIFFPAPAPAFVISTWQDQPVIAHEQSPHE